jgi:hypothetical protein
MITNTPGHIQYNNRATDLALKDLEFRAHELKQGGLVTLERNTYSVTYVNDNFHVTRTNKSLSNLIERTVSTLNGPSTAYKIETALNSGKLLSKPVEPVAEKSVPTVRDEFVSAFLDFVNPDWAKMLTQQTSHNGYEARGTTLVALCAKQGLPVEKVITLINTHDHGRLAYKKCMRMDEFEFIHYFRSLYFEKYPDDVEKIIAVTRHNAEIKISKPPAPHTENDSSANNEKEITIEISLPKEPRKIVDYKSVENEFIALQKDINDPRWAEEILNRDTSFIIAACAEKEIPVKIAIGIINNMRLEDYFTGEKIPSKATYANKLIGTKFYEARWITGGTGNAIAHFLYACKREMTYEREMSLKPNIEREMTTFPQE